MEQFSRKRKSVNFDGLSTSILCAILNQIYYFYGTISTYLLYHVIVIKFSKFSTSLKVFNQFELWFFYVIFNTSSDRCNF